MGYWLQSWPIILHKFVHYYSIIPLFPHDSQDLDELLQGLSLPTWSDSDIALPDNSISILEIEAAILVFPPQKKALGPDGFPADFYKVYMKQLAPRLNMLFAHCLEHGALLASMMETYMVLLCKPGKDPQECASYHPIALLNMDLKILTKVLASCLPGSSCPWTLT